ncbi:MAG: hypothetical protein WBC07_01600 [Methylotenera sp.]
MKIISILLLLLSLNLQAEELYSSVDDYLKTLPAVNEEQQFNKELPKEQDPSRAVSKNKRWYVGYGPGGTNYSAYLYLLEANKQGKLKLVTKIDTNEEWQYPYLFEEVAFDSNDKFNVSIQLVQGGHASHTYYFQLIKNRWYLVGDNFSELAQCGEGDDAQESDSLQVSTNYLTGKIEEQRYSEKDCNPLKLVKKKRKFSLVPLTDFYPYMEIAPKH